ncbi:MAG: hypothetical protein AAB215_08865, partial [Planctomycetota bacterium]
MRTDQRSSPFSEYLLYDLETGHYKGVVFENLGEIWWGCLHRRPGTDDYYALRPDGVHAVYWSAGSAVNLGGGGFETGELPRLAEWQGSDTLWVLPHSEHPGLYRVTFEERRPEARDNEPPFPPAPSRGSGGRAGPPRGEALPRVSMRRVADLFPAERKAGYAYQPSALMVTPGGRIWAAFNPGVLVVFFDPATGAVRFVRNEGSPEKFTFFPEAVLIGAQAYDVETGAELGAAPAIPPHRRAKRWLDKVVGDDGKLYDVDERTGALTLWGEMPTTHLVPPPPGDEKRWHASIAWHATHGERAYGTSRFSDPRIEIVICHVPSKRLTREPLDWRPAKPQKSYSMHVGPDGAVYGSNYSLAMWRVDARTGECR